ncbi:hypothetical protein KUCAC02_033705 [Chaenocephalus aceratus]|nr:hypothetical protein KUCAC02_033705 [Chaenocephalus aceratus]
MRTRPGSKPTEELSVFLIGATSVTTASFWDIISPQKQDACIWTPAGISFHAFSFVNSEKESVSDAKAARLFSPVGVDGHAGCGCGRVRSHSVETLGQSGGGRASAQSLRDVFVIPASTDSSAARPLAPEAKKTCIAMRRRSVIPSVFKEETVLRDYKGNIVCKTWRFITNS